MSSVSGLSTSLINAYNVFQSTKTLSTADMFKSLSLELGGDGTKITKDQLNTYIKNAESGSTKVSDDTLSALKNLQTNWDTISGGEDSITADDMKNYSSLLVKTVLNGFTSSTDTDSTSSTSDSTSSATSSSTITDINAYLIESALSTSTSDTSTSSLTSCLKTLLTGTSDENDDSNANLIATLTNLIANRTSTSTIETEA